MRAFEAIGLESAAEQAFDCLRPGGDGDGDRHDPVGQEIELEGGVSVSGSTR